jgi:hypothetical protein
MTTLVINELRGTLEQDIIYINRQEVYAIRPYLYFHNDPSGTFTISLKYGSTILGSTSLTMNEILTNANWTAGQYHHAFIRFSFDNPVVLNPHITYTIELSQSGYTYSGTSYLGWIKEYENTTNQDDETAYSDDFKRPFSHQIWSYK